MFLIAICDDEKVFREKIKEILRNYMLKKGEDFAIDTFASGKEFLEQGIEVMRYTVIFLDINMEHMDGIETAKKIRKNNKDVFIVFITALINYTLEGYKVDAVRYILKKDRGMTASVYECMDAIYEKINANVPKKKFDFREGVRLVSLDRILYVESKLHRLDIYVMEENLKKYTMLKTLNELEAGLCGELFLRVHQSYLVNMKYIKSISRSSVIFTKGGEEIEISIPRARYKEVERRLIAYRGEV